MRLMLFPHTNFCQLQSVRIASSNLPPLCQFAWLGGIEVQSQSFITVRMCPSAAHTRRTKAGNETEDVKFTEATGS